MAKNKEKWECGDCGAWNSHKADSCTAGEYHELHEQLLQYRYAIGSLEAQLKKAAHAHKYTTTEEFVESLGKQLQEYLEQTYGKNAKDVHREDLMSATMSFMEAAWIIHQHSV